MSKRSKRNAYGNKRFPNKNRSNLQISNESPHQELARLIRQNKRAFKAYKYRNSSFLEDISDNEEIHTKQVRNIVTAKQVDWEILPLGWWRNPRYKHQLESIFKSKVQSQLFLERLEFIETLNPKEIYRSRFNDKGSPYYVFVFSNCVVAENPLEGNALYVVKGLESWRILLGLSKAELQQRYRDRVRRIIHKWDWKGRLQEELLVS